MSGFSPAWLALREAADHRSRAAALAATVKVAFSSRAAVKVVDLGCGTGSNLRATFRLLPTAQAWTLVDYDERLLAAARESLSAWADRREAVGEGLRLVKSGRRLDVAFRRADANQDLDHALGPAGAADLVTASAFFDLCSSAYMERFAQAVAARRASFYTVLTYNGEQSWTPAHAADPQMTAAFHAHQRTDKGFGAAAGPDSARALADAFRAVGYLVTEGDSPWVLDTADQALLGELAAGYAGAVAETAGVAADVVADWGSIARTAARVGHTDTFARPV